MKKLLAVITFILLLSPSIVIAKTAESKNSPPVIQQIAPNSYYYNYNIQEIQKDPDGAGSMPVETFYQYNYVLITGKPTRQKVLDAIKAAESTKSPMAVEAVAANRTVALERLAEISSMSYSQIDTHIDNVFGGLSAAQKTSLKKLYKAVLALIKQMDLE